MSVFDCNKKFKKVEGNSQKSTKNLFVLNGLIDQYNNILDLPKFRSGNTEVSEKASKKLGRKVRLYTEEDSGKKALPIVDVFREIDALNRSLKYKKPEKTAEPVVDSEIQTKLDKIVDDINNSPEPEDVTGIEKEEPSVEEEIATPTEEVKPGVTELFESNPELASIGTQEQYSQYLDTIFPDSKVKDIVYHGTKGDKFDKFKSSETGTFGKGVYFGDYKTALQSTDVLDDFTLEPKKGFDKDKIIPALINTQNIFQRDLGGNGIRNEYVVEPEQIYILGNKQDIEGFKKFVEKPTELNKLVTLDELERDKSFQNTAVEFVAEIPSERDIPIAFRNVNKGEKFLFVKDLFKQKFEEKAWTKSATQKDGSKATPFPADQFSSFEEFLTFALLHEKAHEYIFKNDTETIGEYEDRINNEALSKLSKIIEKPSEGKQLPLFNLSEKSKELQQLPNSQWFNKVVQPVINRFSKLFPNVRVNVISIDGIPDDLKDVVAALDKQEKQVNSFYHKGQVYLIKERVNKDIAIEEFLHPFINALEQDNPELFKSLLLEAKKLFPDLKDKIFATYKEAYDSMLDMNREFLTQALTQKVSEAMPEEQKGLFERFKQWLKGILNRMFGTDAQAKNISELDQTMSLNDIAALLMKENTSFNFNPETNTTYFSLDESEMDSYLNMPNLNTFQRNSLNSIFANNKVTETEFTEDKHTYKRLNYDGTLLTDKIFPVSSLLGAPRDLDVEFQGFKELGNHVHDILKNLNTKELSNDKIVEKTLKNSEFRRFMVEEKGYPEETAREFVKEIVRYLDFLKNKGSVLVSEVSISALESNPTLGYEGVGGTIDLLEITPEGKYVIHDFKTMFLNYKSYFTSGPKALLDQKFRDKKAYVTKQLSLYAKLLKGVVGTDAKIDLQIVPIGYIAEIERTSEGVVTFNAPKNSEGEVDVINEGAVKSLSYAPIRLISVDNAEYALSYDKKFADKFLPSIEEKPTIELSQEEKDKQKIIDKLTDELKGNNSKRFEAEIEKTFKKIVSIYQQYGTSKDQVRAEVYKVFDPDGAIFKDETRLREAFDQMSKMAEDDPEKLKQYLSTVIQYINFIEEMNTGLVNVRDNMYKIYSKKGTISDYQLLDEMRKSYVFAVSNAKQISDTLKTLEGIEDNNLFKMMLKNSLGTISEIRDYYFDMTLPITANIINSYITPEFRQKFSKEYEDRIASKRAEIANARSKNYQTDAMEKELAEYEKILEGINSPDTIEKIIKGEFGDADWFYSSLLADINNPDMVIAGTHLAMESFMMDLKEISIPRQEAFGMQVSKREKAYGLNRDQVKKLNKDLVYEVTERIRKSDGTFEDMKVMTLLTKVDQNIWYDYDVLLDNLKNATTDAEKEAAKKEIKKFEKENFENLYTDEYQQVLDSLDTVVSDGRNIKDVYQSKMEAIRSLQTSIDYRNYLNGNANEDFVKQLRDAWRDYNNLFSVNDRDGAPKTGADLEIAEKLSERREKLSKFRDRVPDMKAWEKLKSKKIQSLISKYGTEEEVLKSEEYKQWQESNTVFTSTDEFLQKRADLMQQIRDILSKKEYKDDALVQSLKDNISDNWRKLTSIATEYRDNERDIISGDVPEKAKESMKQLELAINNAKAQIKAVEEKLSKEDADKLGKLYEEYNGMVTYKNTKYYEEDLYNAMSEYAFENKISIEELRSNPALFARFKLTNKWYQDSHIIKDVYNPVTGKKEGVYEPVYYYKNIIPSDPSYIKELPAQQYYSYKPKESAINPNAYDMFGRKNVKESSKYITQNTAYKKIANGTSTIDRVNKENLDFLQAAMEEAQKGLNKHNYLYYRIPSMMKSTFDRLSEGQIKRTAQSVKNDFVKIAQDEDKFGTRSVLVDLNGNEAKFIPVLYKNKIDIEDQSFDIFSSIMKYQLSATKAKMMEQKLSAFETLVDQLENNMVADDLNKVEAIGASLSSKYNLKNLEEKIKSKKYTRLENVKNIINKVVYEEYEQEMFTVMGISDVKLTNTLLKYAGANMMMLNIPNWFVNYFSGNIQLMIEAAGSRYFGKSELGFAQLEVKKRIKDIVGDISKTHDKSLIGQLMDYCDPIKGEYFDEFGNKFSWSARKNLKSILFIGKNFGELEMQMVCFVAMMKAKKVEQIVNGVSKTISLYDAWEKGTDGIPVLKQGVQISKEEIRSYITKIQGVNKSLNGSYAKIDSTKIEKYSLGKLAVFMKKFFVPLFVNRFGGLRGDMELQDVREGHYVSFYKSVLKDLFRYRGNISEIYAKFKLPVDQGGYTDLQKQAIAKTLMEATAILFLFLALAALGYDDDEDDSDAVKYLQYLTLRTRRELVTFTPIVAPQEAVSFFSRPFAAMGSLGNLANLAVLSVKTPIALTTGAFEDDVFYQRDTALFDKGDSKFIGVLTKVLGLKLNVTDPQQLLQGYNYSIRW